MAHLPSLIHNSPCGDGHPVIVFPGFCASPINTALLRWTLRKAGYDARDWGQGFNSGPSDELDRRMVETLLQINDETSQKVSLIGWSLGGLYARQLANTHPHIIRRVITLGSPHRADPNNSQLRALFNAISPKKLSEIKSLDLSSIRNDPPLPVTSIYTKTDGVVNWMDCLCDETHMAENIEVQGSHMGLTHNVKALDVILKRLALSHL